MAWTADGSALSDHTTFVRVLNEAATAQLRGRRNPQIPYAYGEYSVADKYYTGTTIQLEVGLIHTTADTHLSELQSMFGKTTGYVTLQRTDHPAGTVQADVQLAQLPRQTQDRFTYLFSLRNPDGFWEDATVTSVGPGTAPSITTGGNRPIGDPVITFAGPGTAILVTAWGTANMEWNGTGTAIVDCAIPRSVTKAGAAQDNNFVINQPWWFKFAHDTTVDLTSTVDITVDYRNKHA